MSEQTDDTITYIDHDNPEATAYRSDLARHDHVHVRGSDRCIKRRDGERCPDLVRPETLRCPKCTGLLAEATGVCTVCGADPLGYYCDELDHSGCGHTR